MAVTSIWKINSRLDQVLNYVANKNKTFNQEYGNVYDNLHNLIDYVGAEYKTEKQYYVSGINCSKETALDEMIITKKQYGKTDGIQAFHIIQSFKEGEVTPELAHKVGMELAEELFGDRFEVIVSTHLNTNHYHNHIVLNSVSFKDGKRYYDNNTTYSLIRTTSDLICEEHGLSVIKNKKLKVDYPKIYEGRIVKSNYYTTTKEDIDFAIRQAYSYQDFLNILKQLDYMIFFRANKISVRREPYKRNIRIERAFGEDYSISKIQERIMSEYSTRVPFIEVYKSKRHKYFTNNKNIKHKEKAKGVYGLYLHYCYLLKIFPKVYPNNYIPPSIRADVKKMDRLSKEARLLSRNKIINKEDLDNYISNLNDDLRELQAKREDYYIVLKRNNNVDKNKIQDEITDITSKINFIKEEEMMCREIKNRIPKIEENLKEIKKENKERSKEKDAKFK